MNVHCYARRRLRPFHGTVQTVAVSFADHAGHGEAETADGRTWNLYVGHPELVAHTGLSEVRFGTWHAGERVKRAAVRGTARSGLIEDIGAQLIAALAAHADAVPFALQDRHECWLLDRDAHPLALIDAVINPDERSPWERPRWHPGSAAEAGFHTAAGGVAELVAQVAALAGPPPRAVWIERRDDGGGTDERGRVLSAEAFPPALLRADWVRDEHTALAQAFLAWQAPWLLQLSGFDDAARACLETAAWQRPQEVARAYRLYPRVLDPEALQIARVQARLMGEDDDRGMYQEPFLPVYVEV